MELDIVVQYILSLAPAVTAVIGMVVSVVVAVHKVKMMKTDVEERTSLLKDHVNDVRKENIELKKQLTKTMAKLEHIHFIDKED